MSPPSNKIDSRGRLYMLVYNLRHMRRWEKVFCSFLLGFVVSASTSKNLATFMDSFFMIFMYTIWLLISVPSLYKKLTAKFVKTFLYVVVLTFFADGLIFGLYRFLRRHLNDTEVYFDAVEQRGFIFVMNGIRLLFLAFCVLRSVTYTDIKAAKTPVKRNTRSSKRASGGRSKTPVRQSKTSWWSWQRNTRQATTHLNNLVDQCPSRAVHQTRWRNVIDITNIVNSWIRKWRSFNYLICFKHQHFSSDKKELLACFLKNVEKTHTFC